MTAESASSAWARAAGHLDCGAAAVGRRRPLADAHDHAVHPAVGGRAAVAATAAAQFRKPATGVQETVNAQQRCCFVVLSRPAPIASESRCQQLADGLQRLSLPADAQAAGSTPAHGRAPLLPPPPQLRSWAACQAGTRQQSNLTAAIISQRTQSTPPWAWRCSRPDFRGLRLGPPPSRSSAA
jgi:hypothetical protein